MKRYKEEKQVGILYHFRREIQSVIKSLTVGLKGNLTYGETMTLLYPTFNLPKDKKLFVYCFTRNKNWNFKGKANYKCLLVLNGTKMSNKYKFIPIQERYMQRKDNRSEFEERIINEKEFIDIKSYLVEIHVNESVKDIKNLDKLKKICEKENIKLTITNK